MTPHLIILSKFLSLVLRHKPDEIGVTLDNQGWADVEELLDRATRAGRPLTRDVLEEVVATSDRKRFAFSPDGTKIRASQGHSVDVDLALEPRQPPEVLFHGTATRFLESIRDKGLLRGKRRHVHLSLEEATAVNVGKRHGKPQVLRIRAGDMHRAGILFFCSANGVWLTEHVAPAYIEFPHDP